MASRTTSPKARGPSKAVQQKAKPGDAAEPSVYTVFISHSSKEKWIARQISKEIEALGAKTWLDTKDLRGGDEIRRSIKRGIRVSREVIVLLSENSITSQWVIFEAAIADGQGKRITPVLNNLSPDVMPTPLQGIKAIDLNDFDDFLLELARRIKNRLDKDRKAAS
jgi:hypothetical protein